MSDLVGNPEDRFSHNEAHIILTGYIVFSGIRRSSGVQGLRVIVQSDRTPDYVEGRIEAFLHSMEVKTMS